LAVVLVLGLHLIVLNSYRTPTNINASASSAAIEVAYLISLPDAAPRFAPSEGPLSPPLPVPTTKPEVRITAPVEVPVDSALSKNGTATEEFIDARLLIFRPAPTEVVALPQPEINDPRKSGRAAFSLFVNREGRVIRVRVDSSTLPEDVEQQSEQVFFQTHFRPGVLDGKAVNSRLQIEVVFDSPGGTSEMSGKAIVEDLAQPRL